MFKNILYVKTFENGTQLPDANFAIKKYKFSL